MSAKKLITRFITRELFEIDDIIKVYDTYLKIISRNFGYNGQFIYQVKELKSSEVFYEN
jgi:hypothetical protein